MQQLPDPIDVRRYDAVVHAIGESPNADFQLIAEQCGVAASTVEKIWDGRISRPPVVVVERLEKPRRCPDCGARCVEWPCILCEIRRRNGLRGGKVAAKAIRFRYKTQSK
jgi:hypothetical protein